MINNEWILAAEKIRNNDRFGSIDPKDLLEFSVNKEKIVIDTTQGKVDVYMFSPKNPQKDLPVLINFHGGGFIKGRYERDDLMCSRIAHKVNCIVFDVDYSLAPEHPYPTATIESSEVVAWVFENCKNYGGNAKKIALSGQSAGGNLACSVIFNSKNNPIVKPCAAIICWAPLDLNTDPSEKTRPANDMPPERAALYNKFYCTDYDTTLPTLSPVFASDEELSLFPNTLFIIANQDSLAKENLQLASKLAAVGVRTTIHNFMDSMHGFLSNRMAQWEEADKLFCDFLTQEFKK